MNKLELFGMKIEKTAWGWALRYDGGSYRSFDTRDEALDFADYEIGQAEYGETAPDEMERSFGL